MTSTDHLDLDAIEARAFAAEDGWHVAFDNDTYRHEIHGDGPTHVAVFGGNPDDAFASYPVEANAEFAAHARADVPLLVAEVRRLRTELAAARRPDTPRLCECGHGHRAHTVPAPHSCFAFGQTCPCPAFRQLPHDQAVAQLEANRQAAAERDAARIAEEMRAVGEEADADPICGDENDGDWCELDPGHDGHHRADTAEWAADPAAPAVVPAR